MNIWQIIHFLTFQTCITFSIFILIKNPKSRLNISYAALIFSYALWIFSNIFLHNSTATIDTAKLFMRIGTIGWVLFSYLAMWFCTVFTGRHTRQFKYLLGVALIPPLLLIAMQWHSDAIVKIDLTCKQPYGWRPKFSNTIWVKMFLLCHITYMMISLYMCLSFYRRTKVILQKKQTLVITITGIVAIVPGLILAVILRKVTVHAPIVSDYIGLANAIGFYYAITRYKLFAFTPSSAADDILRTMSDALLLIDSRGSIQYANSAAVKLLASNLNQLRHKRIEALFNDVQFDKMILELQEQKSSRSLETYCIFPTGSKIPVLFTASAMIDGNKHLQGVVCLIRDISGRIQAEEEAHQLQMKMFASSKLATLGEVATGVAHEINQPLTYIHGLFQKLLMRTGSGTIDETILPDKLKEGLRQANRIVFIIDHMRSFGRQYEIPNERIGLEKILDNTLLLMGERIRLRNIDLVRDIQRNLPALRCNANQIEQVFINLFQNSIDAFGSQTKNARIEIKMRLQDNQVSVNFSDNGHGIDETVRERIFEPFFTTKNYSGSTGLGLSISYGIIRDHEGTIECESERNRGTSFTIRLPIG